MKNTLYFKVIQKIKKDEITFKLQKFFLLFIIKLKVFFKKLHINFNKKLDYIILNIKFKKYVAKHEKQSRQFVKRTDKAIKKIKKYAKKFFKGSQHKTMTKFLKNDTRKQYRTIDKKVILTKREKELNSQKEESEERIDEMLELIRIIWSKPKNTQLRLGQLILNVISEDRLYYVEDEELYKLLKRQYISNVRELSL